MPNTSTNPSTLLHVMCDYAPNGLEFGEITSRLQYHLANPHGVRIHPTSVPSLDTISIGFVTAQYAFAPHEGQMFIYGNAAPRREGGSKAMKNNIDHGIKYARLDNGVEIINVYSEFAFGFVKKHIVEFRDIDCPADGSQFRSRDFFPERVARLVNGDRSILTTELDINDIPEGEGLLEILMEKGKDSEILAKLPTTALNLDNISLGGARLLLAFAQVGKVDEVFSRLPTTIDTGTISIYSARLLQALILEGHSDEVRARIPELKAGIEVAKNILRPQLTSQELIDYHPTQKYGLTLTEIIHNFPIQQDSITKAPYGWTKAKLSKEGSDSHVYLRQNEQNEVTNIIFANTDISINALKIYHEAFLLLPEFVSAPQYPELLSSEFKSRMKPHLLKDGFREVYAGPALSSLEYAQLPKALKKSITLQKLYIFTTLAENNMHHGHPHDDNFNIRFLLEKEGLKQIIFDINQALQLTVTEGYALTPIVTLRDWDAGRST